MKEREERREAVEGGGENEPPPHPGIYVSNLESCNQETRLRGRNWRYLNKHSMDKENTCNPGNLRPRSHRLPERKRARQPERQPERKLDS